MRRRKIKIVKPDSKYRIAIVLTIMLAVSYCYFLQNPINWNSVPRLALTISIIENGSFTIDRFKDYTQDLAYYEGSYYTDKAPGMSFMALPSVAAARYYLLSEYKNVKWVSLFSGPTLEFIFLEQWATVTTSGLAAVLTALAIYFLALRLGAGAGGAVFAALSYGLATPAWGWATAFFSHTTAGGCLFLGLTAIYIMLDSPACKRRDLFLGFVSGALLSWAVVVELPSAPVSAMIAVYALYSARGWGRERFLRVFVSAAAGAVLFILPLLLYHYMITGDLFTPMYSYTIYFAEMKEGIFGLGTPRLDVLISLLFSNKYGIFWFSPLLLAAVPSLYFLWRRGRKGLTLIIAATALYYLLLNSSFAYWTGGGSTGPRYLTPMLPFLCLPIALLWTAVGKMLKTVLLALFGLSFTLNLICVSVFMTLQYEKDLNIFTYAMFPLFLNGENFQFSLPLRWIFSVSALNDNNNILFLIPLLLFLACCAFYLVLTILRSNEKST